MTAVVCIADDQDWLEAMEAQARSPLQRVSWPEFDQKSLTLADARRVGLARMEAEPIVLNQRLGRLCRAFPAGAIVEWVGSDAVADEQFFAYGFKKLLGKDIELPNENGCDNFLLSTARCFEYRLSDYKAVPDWLNARFWAHPERFHL